MRTEEIVRGSGIEISGFARFARKRNVCRFSGLRKRGERRVVREENASSGKKSFRLDDTAASSNNRKRGDDIVHCFQEISPYLMAKGIKATKRVFRTCVHAARLPLSADLFKYKIREEIREFFGDGARRQCPAINSICSSGGGLTRIVERKRILARIDFS